MGANEWISTVNLLGAVQGLFLAALLASKRRNAVPNTLLALAMFTFSIDLFVAVYHARGYDVLFPHGIGVTYTFPLVYGPLIYLFARTLTEGRQTFERAYLWHFLPFVLLTVGLVPFFLQSGAAKLAFLQTPEQSAWTAPLTTINHLKFVHTFVYVALTVRLLHHQHQQSRQAARPQIDLSWLRLFAVGIVVLWVLALGVHGVSLWNGVDPVEGYGDYMALAVTVFVYAIGYTGLRRQPLFAANTPEEEARPRYAKSGMDPEEARRSTQRLLQVMEAEKPYRNSGLTLQDLADHLGLSPHNLSEIINTQLDQNFYDFVNGYRVREVQERLIDPESAHLTLLAIGMEAGFNSKSSFNAVFKKHARMTPSRYRRQHLESV